LAVEFAFVGDVDSNHGVGVCFMGAGDC